MINKWTNHTIHKCWKCNNKEGTFGVYLIPSKVLEGNNQKIQKMLKIKSALKPKFIFLQLKCG